MASKIALHKRNRERVIMLHSFALATLRQAIKEISTIRGLQMI